MQNNKNAAVLDRNDLTKGPIVKKLLMFALPIIAGNIVQQLYNVVDTIVVGNFVGSDAIAAVSVSFPVMMLFNALFMGLSMGANIVISQKRGAGDSEGLSLALTTMLSIVLWGGAVITILGSIFARPLLELLNTPANIIDDSNAYLTIIFIGTIGNMLYNSCNGAARGMGDSKWAFYALAISSVTNVVLDLVFVVAFGWGVAGVAIATTLAHILSGAIMLYRLASGKYPGRVRIRDIGKIDKGTMSTILRLGVPSSIQSAAGSLGNLMIQSFANMFGSNYISANSIAVKIDGFAIMPLMGLGMAITTFVGQNIGAGDDERADEGVKKTAMMVIAIGGILAVVLMNFGYYIMRLFTDEVVVLDMARQGIKVLALTYVFMGLQNTYGGAMRGSGAALAPALITIFTTFLRIPVSYFLAVKPLNEAADAAVSAGLYATRELARAAGVGVADNFMGMFWGMAIATISGSIIIMAYYFFGNWRKHAIRYEKKPVPGNGNMENAEKVEVPVKHDAKTETDEVENNNKE
ncbi:MAG: MATE family efflux transporter [Anaerofustis stercorihominis]|nr:MATE family efflux transporter [Anaerofustis stercorihominis]